MLALSRAGIFVFWCIMLPDYLAQNLDIVFVGLNPGSYSDKQGHYFARPTNLFWTALFESGLVRERLMPRDDERLNQFGYGLTDLVSRATPNIDSLTQDEFIAGGEVLRAKIHRYAPRVVCFVGLTGYRAAFDKRAVPGAQSSPGWGNTRIFIVPSTSPRNAFYRLQVIEWFAQLKTFFDNLSR